MKIEAYLMAVLTCDNKVIPASQSEYVAPFQDWTVQPMVISYDK